MEKKKVLFISQEITPYLRENEMSHISRYLPQGIQERGKEIRAFMPKFGTISERRNQLHEVIRLSGMNIIIDDTDHSLIIKVASIQSARMQVYFIDNDDYFQRKFTVKDAAGNYFEDNDERMVFFNRGVLETVKKLRWSPDIIHCHGWMTALIPLYIKRAYHEDPLFAHTKVVYSVYDDEFSDPFPKNFKDKIKFEKINDNDLNAMDQNDFGGLTKLAVEYSDALVKGNIKINNSVDSFLGTINKPLLTYQNKDEYIDAYNSLYDSILV